MSEFNINECISVCMQIQCSNCLLSDLSGLHQINYLTTYRASMQPVQKSMPLTVHNSPSHSRPNRSKSRLLRQNRPIYLTDGQISSSDHTNNNKSCSEISLMRIQYQSKVRKLQRENKQLREQIVTLKASQYYQVDQQRIKTIIRQNQSLKITISQLQSDVKLLDEEIQKIMVESEYLKKSNKTLKNELELLVKESVRERHNYMAFTNTNNNSASSFVNTNKKPQASYCNDQHQQFDQRQQCRLTYRQQLKLESSTQLQDDHKDNNSNKVNSFSIQPRFDKTGNKLPIKMRNKSRSNRSSSKSNEKLLLGSLVGQKVLTKRHKKQSSEIPSTGESQNIIKHYKSSTKLRGEMKSRQSYMPTSRSPNPYDTQGDYLRKKTQSNTAVQYNEDYYVVKREVVANKAKKNIYYI